MRTLEISLDERVAAELETLSRRDDRAPADVAAEMVARQVTIAAARTRLEEPALRA